MTLDDLLIDAGEELDRLSATHAVDVAGSFARAGQRRWMAVAAATGLVVWSAGTFVAVRSQSSDRAVTGLVPGTTTPGTTTQVTTTPDTTTPDTTLPVDADSGLQPPSSTLPVGKLFAIDFEPGTVLAEPAPYVIEEGDYPSTIASKFKVPFDDVMILNDWTLQDDGVVPEWPGAGQTILIPSGATVPGMLWASGTDTGSIDRTIVLGSTGDDVVTLNQRLRQLGFVTGSDDGTFGPVSQQAVWAWRKLVGGQSWRDLDRSSDRMVVTPVLWQAIMLQPVDITPRRPSGDGASHIEVYLPSQVLVVFDADRPVLIAHLSSGEIDVAGNPTTWCEATTIDTDADGAPLDPPVERSFCAQSLTPGGVFSVNRRYEGTRVGPLGGMLDPIYFNYGIAIHGAENVPTSPVSHGAVRVNTTAIEESVPLVDLGDAVFVWGHDGREPEDYARRESLPSFGYPDPNG